MKLHWQQLQLSGSGFTNVVAQLDYAEGSENSVQTLKAVSSPPGIIYKWEEWLKT